MKETLHMDSLKERGDKLIAMVVFTKVHSITVKNKGKVLINGSMVIITKEVL
jgi:hypothetical protein